MTTPNITRAQVTTQLRCTNREARQVVLLVRNVFPQMDGYCIVRFFPVTWQMRLALRIVRFDEPDYDISTFPSPLC